MRSSSFRAARRAVNQEESHDGEWSVNDRMRSVCGA
jgi:hypothetical protein